MNVDSFIAGIAILIIVYIVYKSFFDGKDVKETVIETVNEAKKQAETVVAKVEEVAVKVEEVAVKVEEEVKEVATEAVTKTKAAAKKPRTKIATKPVKVNKTKVKK
jgi:uncharacterized protein YfcZ (UPF0381/DUF406 family)